MLLMKKEYFDAIRRGEKTTTLRYWRWPHVQPGTVHVIRGLGRVRIDDLAPVSPQDLTDAHAQADGFDSLAALREAMDAMYPPARRRGRRLYLVRFTFLDSSAQPPARPPAAPLTPPSPPS